MISPSRIPVDPQAARDAVRKTKMAVRTSLRKTLLHDRLPTLRDSGARSLPERVSYLAASSSRPAPLGRDVFFGEFASSSTALEFSNRST
jgi:hypothetical protein